ncbi:trigger factor [Microlunatus parietis]|uniref:Trigger factor n=1 Tax=Microlunatus parietis TaxID=682979 RepID=A0A7Y9ICZ9_9ACTN|nr:trigger factor [Microlunatus parietis]NYE74643.1 trigger factor [Microlunatus parietis]
MPSTVEQLSPSRVKITVEVPFDELKPSVDKTYQAIAQQITIPGFRKGKVPPMVIDQRYGRGAVLQEAINDALPGLYGKAVSDNKLSPLAQPDIEVTKLEDNDLLEFTAEVEVRPEFELPELESLAATVDALEVDEERVTEQLDALRARFGSRETVERAAAEGDVVTIDLEASVDGEVLEDATAEGMEYEIGSGSMLEGLDEAVTGLSAGESATFTSKLVGGPHKDEDAEIKVTVSTVAEQNLPELDDEFAQLASEFDTLDEMKDDIRTRLINMSRLEQASEARDKVLEDLIGKIDFDVPEGALAADVEARKEQINRQLGQAGLSLEQYLTESEEAESEESFWADVEKRAADALKAQIVLDKLAEEREVPVDQNDLTQHIVRLAQQQGSNPQQIADHLQEHPHHVNEYMTEIRRGKALALVVEAATVTDANGERVELDRLQPDGTLADPVIEADEVEAEEPVAK